MFFSTQSVAASILTKLEGDTLKNITKNVIRLYTQRLLKQNNAESTMITEGIQRSVCACSTLSVKAMVDNFKEADLKNEFPTGQGIVSKPMSASFHSSPSLLRSEKRVYEQWRKTFKESEHLCQAVFVLGPMGSGKTTVINTEFRKHDTYKNYAYVDTDEIMEELEGFNEKSVHIYYPVARRIAIDLTDWLLEEKISFVAEGTCVQFEELKDYIIRLKNSGYHIKVRKLDEAPLELAVKRARNRARRLIEEEEIRNIYIHSMQGLKELYSYNKTMNLFEEL